MTDRELEALVEAVEAEYKLIRAKHDLAQGYISRELLATLDQRYAHILERIEALDEDRPPRVCIPGVTDRLDRVVADVRHMHRDIRRALGDARSS